MLSNGEGLRRPKSQGFLYTCLAGDCADSVTGYLLPLVVETRELAPKRVDTTLLGFS